ncbi:hypothetical protein LPB140_06105 [Sphingorhabdus lutea]|uniref:Insulinase family protein n=1 Tax=Sphingorhabdus lutea TaxID=1913578 RepID=A0A1L3JBB8_9SPHN|nr:insulinase family protein [Sphingorhabdus lutea]APG62434.1 hypothetical protein LPB140_06105 [Sphingorhabdus lutea]
MRKNILSSISLSRHALAAAIIFSTPHISYAQEQVENQTAEQEQAEIKQDDDNQIAKNAADKIEISPSPYRVKAWNSDKSDLPAHPDIIYGRLPNGLKYAIKKNSRPENQVLIRMAVDFGSAVEGEDEQGLAHFIEHMAFNGTTNVPEGEMVKILERLGLAFGADTNASTGFTQTQYQLDLPNNSAELIEESLFLMRETASEISFAPSAVEAERGVILEEMRVRENYQYQAYRAASKFLSPGTYSATRFPIGAENILKTAPADRMKSLYQKWYRPDRTRIIVVGAVDVDHIESHIIDQFSDWSGSAAQYGPINGCYIDVNRPSEAQIFEHPQITNSILLAQFFQDKFRVDDKERLETSLGLSIINQILSSRIGRRQQEEELVLLGGNISYDMNQCREYAQISSSISSKDGEWERALNEFLPMIKQISDYGFSDTEFNDAISRIDQNFRDNAAGESTTSSATFANALVDANDSEVVNSAIDLLSAWNEIKSHLDKDKIHKLFNNIYGKMDRPLVFMATKNKGDIDEKYLLNAVNKAREIDFGPPKQREKAQFAYAKFGKAGKVVFDDKIDDLDIRTIRFKNGVMLNLKNTDFEASTVRFAVRAAGGALSFGRDNADYSTFFSSTFAQGGVGKHDISDMRSILAGSSASFDLDIGDDYFGEYGTVSPNDLKFQMQLIASLMTDPAYRQDAVRLFQKALPEFYTKLKSTPGSVLSIESANILNGDDPRFTLPSLARYNEMNSAQLKKLIGNQLMTAPLEITLIGTFDQEDAIKIIAETFGALPKRNDIIPQFTQARETNWSDNRGEHILYHLGERDQLAWQRVWTISDGREQKKSAAMDLLARIINIKLTDKLREELGASYSAGASADMSEIYPNRGSFSITTNGNVDNADLIGKVVDDIIADVTNNLVSEDIFNRARTPILENYRDWKSKNSTWVGWIDEAQTLPSDLDKFRHSEDIFRSITIEDIRILAAEQLSGQKPFTFKVMHESYRPKAAETQNDTAQLATGTEG